MSSPFFEPKSFAWVWALCLVVVLLSLAAPTQQVTSSVTLSSPSFAGPYLFGYLHTRTGSYTSGLAVLMICALAGGLLILCTPQRARSVG